MFFCQTPYVLLLLQLGKLLFLIYIISHEYQFCSLYIYLAVLLCLENLICWKNKDRKSETCGQKPLLTITKGPR